MRGLRVSTLQGSAAAFCVFTGTVMLVIPYQFEFLKTNVPGSGLLVLGLLFLTAGVFLFGLALLAARYWTVLFLHLFTAVLLFYLAAHLSQAGAWLSLLNASGLGAGLLLSALLPRGWLREGRSAGDLLTLVAGANAALTGLFLLLSRWEDLSHPVYNLEQPLVLLFGLVFLACGVALIATQAAILRRSRKEAQRLGGPAAAWAARLLAAGVFLAFLVAAARPDRFWGAAAYYGSMAAALAALPWLETYLGRFSRSSLHTRLALILALATGLPLILMVAYIFGRDEASVKAAARSRQQNQAAALAEHIADQVRLHRAAVSALAGLPGLLDQQAGDQRLQLLSFARAYPQVASFNLYGAQGEPLASTGSRAPASLDAAGVNFDDLRRTGQPGVEILQPPLLGRPIFTITAPVMDDEGEFAGLAAATLETAAAAEVLNRADQESGSRIYLVDGRGRAIAHPDASAASRLASLSGLPPVQELLEESAVMGSLDYLGPEGEQLAGYAEAPGLGWGVVVERPAAEVLANVNQERELAFIFLLSFLPLTMLAGFLLAGRMAAPLRSLSHALTELAEGNMAVPLPGSSFIELERLARVFGEMRERLARSMFEREQALQALQRSKDELEMRIDERTAALRQREEESRRQRELMLTVFETISAGIAVLAGEELRFQFSNQAYRQLTPHPLVEPAGRTFAEIWPQREEFRGRWLLQRVMDTGKPFDIDHYGQEYPDGSSRYFSLSLRRLEWNGKAAVLVVLWETTALEAVHKIAQDAAEEAQQRAAEAEEGQRILGAIMEHIPEGLAVAEGPEVRIQRISQYGARLSGHSRKELEGMLLQEQLEALQIRYSDGNTPMPPEDYPLARATLTGSITHNEEVVVIRGGRMFHLLCNAGPVRDRNGRISGGVMAWKDITDRKRSEQALQKYAVELERSNRDLQDFAFIASHDLQEPLRKILAFGDRLRKHSGGLLDVEGLDYLGRMQNAATRMRKMIHDLLEYSRVTTRTQPFVLTDMSQVMREVILDLDVSLESSGGRVEWQELPSIESDPLQMRQLLQNLIHNALKFHRAEISPIVTVYGKIVGEREECLQLSVEDNGFGFDEEFLERIFQPFQRLHGRSEFEGSGIGLAICRKIVERHRGSITARSRVGQGSTFLVTLPLKQND